MHRYNGISKFFERLIDRLGENEANRIINRYTKELCEYWESTKAQDISLTDQVEDFIDMFYGWGERKPPPVLNGRPLKYEPELGWLQDCNGNCVIDIADVKVAKVIPLLEQAPRMKATLVKMMRFVCDIDLIKEINAVLEDTEVT